MKTGNQADLRRHLESEHGIIVTKQYIGKLFKAEDYRIVKTPKGKIKIEESAKLLADTGAGSRSESQKNGKSWPGKAKPSYSEKPNKSKPEQPEEDIQDYVTGKKQITIATPPGIIHRYKELQQAEKERIKNETAMEKLIDIDDVGEKSFTLWRKVRDEIQTLKDRTIIKLRSADSDHEAEQIFSKEIQRILNSIVSGYQDLDDEGVKKKLLQLLMQ